MKRVTCAVLVLIAMIYYIVSGAEADHSRSSQLTPQEEYGTELQRGTLIVRADTSTSEVRDWRNARAAEAANYTGDIDQVIYKRTIITDGYHIGEPVNLSMRILFDQDAEGKKPAIVFIPGGGFMSSVMSSLEFYYTYFAASGYVTAVIEYRTIGQGLYTDGVADIRDAVRWIRANAEAYRIDPEKIGLFGASAGGHMAALAAVAPDQDVFRGENNLLYSSEVSCVVSLYASSDLTRIAMDLDPKTQQFHTLPQTCEAQYVNGALSGLGILDNPEEAERANPITYLSGNEPPFLHIHGDADNLISPSMSLLLHNAMLAHHDISIRYSLHGESHGTRGFYSEPAMHLMSVFLEKHLE